VITQSLAQDLAQEFNSPLTPPFTIIAPDGVDLDRYAGLPGPTDARELLSQSKLRDSILSPERFTAGYTGHLYRGRGLSLLLKMATCTPDITYLLVGGEPVEIKRLESDVQSMGINNIILVGFVPNAELPLYQAACDVLMMPYQHKVAASSGGDISRYLSPMKLFEYMACGRAILSSNLQVLKEVLNTQNAVLLPPDDVDAWTNEIQDLRSNHDRLEQLAIQARKDAAQYTWKARAERILDRL
jgi:glycosyltransferase involved in cell wall biosynthesis